MEFEIAKKNSILLVIHLSIAFIILTSLAVLFKDGISLDRSFDSFDTFLVFLIVAMFFVAFKVIPNMRITQHKKDGCIYISNDEIEIKKGTESNTIKIDQVDFLSIKLVGFDGQPRIGDILSQGHGSAKIYSDLRPLNGLGNILKLKFRDKKDKYELYISSQNEYARLKEIINQ